VILQGFVRAEGVDYSAADADIATDEAAGADTAQDGPGESVGDVGRPATVFPGTEHRADPVKQFTCG